MSQWGEAQVRTYLERKLGLDTQRTSEVRMEMLLRSAQEAERSQGDVATALISDATVNESFFLRHANQLEWLTDTWLPRFLARPRLTDRTLRVLSAPCAAGEEPYTLAALLMEPLRRAGWGLEVLGVDVDLRSLEQGRRAVYGSWAIRGVDLSTTPWLEPCGERFRVSAAVRQHVELRRHNLLEPLPATHRFDLILCRNLMIYLHRQAITDLYRSLHSLLRPDGVLLVAPADPSPRDPRLFRVDIGNKLRVIRPVAAKPARAPAAAAAAPTSRPIRRTSRPRVAVSVEPPSDPLPARLAVAADLAAEQHWDRAQAQLSALLQDAPLHVPALVLQTLVALEVGDLPLALTSSRQAAFLASESPYVVFLFGSALVRSGERAAGQRRLRWAQSLLESAPPDARLDHAQDITTTQLQIVIRDLL